MNKQYEIEFIKELKGLEVKTKDIKRLIHSFEIIEMISFEINQQPEQILAAYELSKY